MRQKKIQLNPSIQQIPQKAVNWYLAVRDFPATTGDRNFMYALFEIDRDLILDSNFAVQDFTPKQLLKVLESAMRSPQDSLFGKPHRPKRVAFEQHEICLALEPHLNGAGIAAVFDPQPDLLDALLAEAMTMIDETEDMSMLKAPEVTLSLVAEFFTAASAFYRAAPWKMLDDSQPLTLQFLPDGQTLYAIILGQAKLQYGVLFFNNWPDIQVFSSESSDPLDNIPENGIQSINFEDQENLLPADLQDIHTHGWELPVANIYPYPVIYTKEEAYHPNGQQLARQTAALQAIQRFVAEQLLPNQNGDFSPAQADYSFETGLGPVQVRISYPIEEMPDPELISQDLLSLDEPQAQAALQLAERAWHTEQPSQRVLLAQQALELWPDCVQAHVILGEESNQAEDAYQHFQRGIQAAEKLVNVDQLASIMGHMWLNPGLRYYLMAIQGAVECLIEMEDYQQAQQEAQRLLDYNQADHQGIRYTMLFILTQQNQDAEISELLERFPQEISASWPYSRALLAFKQQGNSPEAQAVLHKALESNPHIPAYLTGQKLIADDLPDFDSFGDEIEAMHYVRDYFGAWWQTKGSLDWLRKVQASASTP